MDARNAWLERPLVPSNISAQVSALSAGDLRRQRTPPPCRFIPALSDSNPSHATHPIHTVCATRLARWSPLDVSPTSPSSSGSTAIAVRRPRVATPRRVTSWSRCLPAHYPARYPDSQSTSIVESFPHLPHPNPRMG